MQAEENINVYSSHCCACIHAQWALLPAACPVRAEQVLSRMVAANLCLEDHHKAL